MRFFSTSLPTKIPAYIITLSIIVSGILLGCYDSTKPPLRVALNVWPGFEFIFLAQELGYYQAEGLNIKLIPFETLADGRRAFEKHQVDVLAATPIELYTIREMTNLKPIIFMLSDFSNGSDMLLAQKTIQNVADLKGKKLALEIGTLDVMNAANALASAQLTFNDVQLTPMPQPNAIQALLAGEVDAVQTYQPFASQALANPNIVRLFDSSQTPGAIIDVLFANEESLQSRSEDYQRLVRAIDRAKQYHADHPEDANQRMAKREKITPAAFKDGMAGLKIVLPGEQIHYLKPGGLSEVLATTHRVLKSIGAINGPPCVNECTTAIAIDPSPMSYP